MPTPAAEDPLDRITDRKLAQVSRLARLLVPRYGPMRVDFVGVKLSSQGVSVRWLGDAG